MRNKILIILILAIFGSATAQTTKKEGRELSKAEKLLSNLNLDKSINEFKRELKSDPNNLDAQEGLIKAYLLEDSRSSDAVSMMGTLYNSGKMSDQMKLEYAQLLAGKGNYTEAASVYKSLTYGSVVNPIFSSVTEDYYKNIAMPNNSIKIRNMSEINSAYSDFSPAIYRDNKLLFVTTRKNRTKTGWGLNSGIKNQFTDLFVAEKMNDTAGIFGNPELFLKSVEHNYMEGPMSFTDNYGVMYMTRSYLNKDEIIRSAADKKTVNLQICRVNYDGESNLDNWTLFTPMQVNLASDVQDFSYAHPAVTNDGKTMYFSSNMPGGYGGTDIWKVEMSGNSWGAPINLGPTINSAGEELFPTLTPDGQTLSYASDGLPGLGGLDVFTTSVSNNGYSTPKNLGAPVNSPYDDFSYVTAVNMTEGYFSSNRPVNGKNMEDDIYAWKQDYKEIIVKVISAQTKAPIQGANVSFPCVDQNTNITDEVGEALYSVSNVDGCSITASADGYQTKTYTIKTLAGQKIIEIPLNREYAPKLKMIVHVYDKETNELLPGSAVAITQLATQQAITGKTNGNGRLKVGGIDPNANYDVKAVHEGYLRSSVSANTRGITPPDSIFVNLYLMRAQVGKVFRIDNIYYDLDKWNIRPDAAAELNNLVQLMYDNPNMTIEMRSHTDCRATESYNQKLSQKRAEAAVDYLVSKGISRSRMTAHGYGESEPVNNCRCEGKVKAHCTEAEYQLNRRTEFKILSL